jgi:hypothetical protein
VYKYEKHKSYDNNDDKATTITEWDLAVLYDELTIVQDSILLRLLITKDGKYVLAKLMM